MPTREANLVFTDRATRVLGVRARWYRTPKYRSKKYLFSSKGTWVLRPREYNVYFWKNSGEEEEEEEEEALNCWRS